MVNYIIVFILLACLQTDLAYLAESTVGWNHIGSGCPKYNLVLLDDLVRYI